MPCSALMLPPCAVDEVVDDAVRPRRVRHEARPARRRRARPGCSADCRRRDGRRSRSGRRAAPLVSAARASSRKRAIADTGSEMSCLMFGPSWRCASAMFSRSAQSAPGLLARLRDRRILRQPALERGAERALELGRERRVRSRSRRPGSARTTDDPDKDPADAGKCLRESAIVYADISSKPVSRSPSACRRS